MNDDPRLSLGCFLPAIEGCARSHAVLPQVMGLATRRLQGSAAGGRTATWAKQLALNPHDWL